MLTRGGGLCTIAEKRRFGMKRVLLVAMFVGVFALNSLWAENFLNIYQVNTIPKGLLTVELVRGKVWGTFEHTGDVYDAGVVRQGKYKKYAADLQFGISYAFAKQFAVGVFFPLYWDSYDQKLDTRDLHNWTSYGAGDVRLQFQYVIPMTRNINLGLYPFLTLPAGQQRRYGPHGESTHDTLDNGALRYYGGLFRDFTTQFYDYGLDAALTYRLDRFTLGFQAGFHNFYQLPFSPDIFNSADAGVAVAYEVTPWLEPVLEVYTEQYVHEKAGWSPVFGNVGLKLGPFAGFQLNLSAGMPVYLQKDLTPELSLPRPLLDPNFPYVFKGSIPNFDPDYRASVELTYSHLFQAYEKGSLKGIVVDGETNTVIPGAEVTLEDVGLFNTDDNGAFEAQDLDEGIYHVMIRSAGYQPTESWVLVKPNETTERTFKLYKFAARQAVFSGKVIDAETQKPLAKAQVTFPGSDIAAVVTGADGTFKVNAKAGVYTVKVSAKDYRSEVFSVYLPADQTTELVVPLEKMERVAVGGYVLPIIYFDLDQYRIKRMYYPELDVVAGILKQNPNLKLEIQGHCSEEASIEYNRKLGMKRAEEVKKYLVERHKIDPDRLVTVSYGEERPAIANDTPDHRYMNRRVEFRVISK